MNCYCQGDDTVAVARWGQGAFANGTLTWPNDSGFATMMQTQTALGVIGGAWHYNAVKSAIGEANVGVALIPEFTLTSANVEGTTIPANTKMRGGTFADCKAFVINAASDASKYEAEQSVLVGVCYFFFHKIPPLDVGRNLDDDSSPVLYQESCL